jgi:hypothetical protein
MKRARPHRRRIIICVPLGLVSTVVMAWLGLGFAWDHLSNNPQEPFVGMTAEIPPCVCSEYRATYAATLRETYFDDRIEIRGNQAIVRDEPPYGWMDVRRPWPIRVPPQPRLEIHEFRGGFPLRCLWGASLDLHLNDPGRRSTSWQGYTHTVELWRASAGPTLAMKGLLNMPIGPIWVGLAVDIAFYTVCWYGLLSQLQLRPHGSQSRPRKSEALDADLKNTGPTDPQR